MLWPRMDFLCILFEIRERPRLSAPRLWKPAQTAGICGKVWEPQAGNVQRPAVLKDRELIF